ncbi:LytTR family DNA-binding domain-containing protein [Bacillus sp. 31A1R]|uniref:LytTR family DNA-binding domain-containing protein n=1 Tax=Robertmurraya mangrovi TaxID=3098077 RepID=A0ABU5IYG8_9BACI|nr:LytTR family DNA-binding domain-containing protein [Bacillus sp. 31A1R]MDZ5472194.1 LytTR family DNA-binding domain-containing protein [Bacillus sp. 31A1R]
MSKWKVILIEDDNVIMKRMKKMIEEDTQIEVIGQASSAKEFYSIYLSLKPDFIISDIDLPDSDGIQIAQILREKQQDIPFIFVSGHAQYAVESYQVEAVDYLLKPIQSSQLKKSLEKMKKRLSNEKIEVKNRVQPSTINKLFVKKEDGFVFLDIPTIVLIRKEGKKTAIITLYNEGSKYFTSTYLTNQTMKELFEILEPHSFLRSHNSYIVNLSWIKEVTQFTPESYKIKFHKLEEYALLNREKLPILIDQIN